jgi:cholesterol transport system auxiliary component
MTTRAHTVLRLLAGLALAATLAGCSIISDKPRNTSTIFAPDPRVQPDPSWPTVDWQLVLAPPNAARLIDSLRIAVRPTPGELQVYRGAQWARTPTDMLQDTLMRTLEDSGRIAAVGRQGTGMAADYKLVMDLRRFESEYTQPGLPAATIEVSAKLIHVPSQRVAASKVFLQAQPAATTAVADVARAFEQSLEKIGHDIGGWTLVSGQAHQQTLPATGAAR